MVDLGQIFADASSKPTIMCDIDNTIAFASESLMSALNARFNLNLLASEQWTYRVETTLTPEQAAYCIKLHTSAIYFANIAPDWHAIDAVARLKTAGFPLVIATNRVATLRTATANWLAEWGVEYDELIIGPTAKVDYARTHPNVVAIDDDPAKIALLPPLGVTLWLPDRPYTPPWAENVKDVHVFTDWNEVLLGVGVTTASV